MYEIYHLSQGQRFNTPNILPALLEEAFSKIIISIFSAPGHQKSYWIINNVGKFHSLADYYLKGFTKPFSGHSNKTIEWFYWKYFNLQSGEFFHNSCSRFDKMLHMESYGTKEQREACLQTFQGEPFHNRLRFAIIHVILPAALEPRLAQPRSHGPPVPAELCRARQKRTLETRLQPPLIIQRRALVRVSTLTLQTR